MAVPSYRQKGGTSIKLINIKESIKLSRKTKVLLDIIFFYCVKNYVENKI